MENKHSKTSQSTDPEELFQLGLAYARGDGVPQNYDRAVDYFFKSAKSNHTKAKRCLGEAQYLGLGIGKDISSAQMFIYQFINEIEFWGWLTRNVEYNESLSFDDYVIAAQNGDVQAQKYLMFVFSNKLLMTQNDELCVYWAKKLVEKSNIDGMYMLAGSYMNARGVPKDYAKAKELLNEIKHRLPREYAADFLLAEIELREKENR